MRRVLLALLGTALGTAVLLGFKTSGGAGLTGLTVATPTDLTGVDPAGTAGPTGTPGPAAGPRPTGHPSSIPGQTPTTPAPGRTTTAPAPGQPHPSTTTTTQAPTSRTILGTAYAAVWNGNSYGSMQVKIVVTGTHIDDIITVRQSNRPKSVSITLRQQALTAQSANVGNVSQATASSNAYKQSLASAISRI